MNYSIFMKNNLTTFKKWYLKQNAVVLFFPFLLLYLIIILLFVPKDFVGDESKYLNFATNLTNGYYSPPYPEIKLWNGPGYPLIIAPIILLKLPILTIRIINAFFLFASLLINFNIISYFNSKKASLLFTCIIGLYFPVFEMLPLIYTEILAWFLVSLICFLFLRINETKNFNWKLILATSLTISFLALTKVIFGYVILAMIFISLLLSLSKRYRQIAFKSAVIFLLSFVFCTPWLFYTYAISGKMLYWGSSGGMSLYTMSSPYAGELGDWSNKEDLLLNPNHHVFMDSIRNFNQIERDDAFKKAAIRNIKNHPEKYLLNWLANTGRLFFSYPFSNSKQSINTYRTLLPNMLLIIIVIQLVIYGWYKKIIYPKELTLLLIFFLIYLAGSTLLSAYRRMFYISIPFWVVFISFFYSKIISLKSED